MCTSEWRGQWAHENVLPKRRGVLQHEQHTRELSWVMRWTGERVHAHLINTSELLVSQP